ncbi:MAG: hypothetical protein IJR49_06425, partial [Treponema sp.]|nr:hypothetical protein [Treponema sp.]
MIKRFFVFIILFSLFSINCIAGIFFANENLNEKNELLFTVKQTIPGAVSYTSLFYAEISSGKPKENPKPVTCYPEQMELYGQSIRIRNRYGSAIYNTTSQRLVWQEYAKSIPLNSMRLSPYVSSPDGKWNCYVQKTGYAQGCLIFENTETGEKAKLDESANFSYSSVPVLWSGDSSLVVYCKNDTLFFCSPDALLSGLEIDEPYREIGRGAVSSVCWAGNTLFYIDGDMLYKINVKELYTLGLYSKIIGKGTPCGRLAEKFDPKTDAFSVNRQNSELLLIKAGKVFSQYIIGGITSEYLTLRFSRPYINSESALLDCEVLWSNDGSPYIWMHLIPFTGDKAKSTVYRIAESFVPLFSISNSYRPVISADRSRVVFFADGEAYVYNV